MNPDEREQFLKEIMQKLQGLPRRAVVAFAVRCARRVQPLFVAGWPDVSLKHRQAVDNAINLVEKYAHGYNIKTNYFSDVGKAAYEAAIAADDVAAYTAAVVAYATAAAAYAAIDDEDAAYEAAAAAYAAADNKDPVARRAELAVQDDLQYLLDYIRRNGWTAQSKVKIPPDFFGPMWPDGEPQGWPKAAIKQESIPTATEASQESLELSETNPPEPEDDFAFDDTDLLPEPPPLEIYLDPGQASKQTLQNVLERLSDLHRAHGGLGLEFERDGLWVLAREKVSL